MSCSKLFLVCLNTEYVSSLIDHLRMARFHFQVDTDYSWYVYVVFIAYYLEINISWFSHGIDMKI